MTNGHPVSAARAFSDEEAITSQDFWTVNYLEAISYRELANGEKRKLLPKLNDLLFVRTFIQQEKATR